MAPFLAVGASVLLVVAAVFYQLVFSRMIHVHGVFRSAVALNNTGCTQVPGTEACEEMAVHSPTGLVYLACSTLESRKVWAPYFNIFTKPSTEDYVALYNPANPTSEAFTRLRLEGFTDPRGLNTHGMDLVPSSKNPKEAFIYLVNHRPYLDGNSTELGANSVIEVFRTVVGSDTLVHVTTFEDPEVVYTPNSVSGSPDGDWVFFTNDFASKTNDVKRHTQLWFNLGWTSVGYCHIDEGCKFAAQKLHGSNGITRTKDAETFYVNENVVGAVGIYSRQADNTLVQIDRINIGRGVDNVSIDEDGNLYLAAFPNGVHFALKTAKDPSILSPSSAYKISLNTGPTSFFGEKYKVEKLFEDDGNVVSGATTALGDPPRGRLYLHGLYAPTMAYCPL